MAATRPTRYLAELVDVAVATPASGDVLTWSAANSRWEAVAGTTTPVPVASGGTGATTASGARTNLGLGSLATLNSVTLASQVTGILPVANGGTGTATPGLVAGSNIAISGTWPNQTIAATAVPTSPGGSTGQLQYNNAGVFGGASWSTIATSGALFTATGANNTDKPILLVGKATAATITNIAITANVATITTSAAHGFVVGRDVALAGLTTVAALNGTRLIVLSVTSTTFTAYCTVSSQASSSETGTATSLSSSVSALELQDGSGRVTVQLNWQPSTTTSGSPTTTPMTGAGTLETWNHATNFQNTPRSFPWLTYNVTTMASHGLAARIALRQGYSAATTYDAAAIDLSLHESGSGGRIRFFVGGSGNGGTLVYAGEFSPNGRLTLAQPLVIQNSTGQNGQFGYSNAVDTNASLFAAGQSNKSFVLQCSSTANTMELQSYNTSTVVGGITNQGNWWMGTPTTNSGTTRLIVAPRQTTDVGLMVAGIASQTGPLFALGGRSSTTDNVAMGYVDAVWSDSTHASRLADVVISTTGYNGTHEAIRFRDTSGIAQPIIPIANVRDAADDAAAAALTPAVPVGGLYRTGSLLKIRVS